MAQTDSVKTLIKQLGEESGEDLSWCGEMIDEVVQWKLRAKDGEEIRQANEALEVLTKNIPASMEARLSDKNLATDLGKTIKFGIKMAMAIMG